MGLFGLGRAYDYKYIPKATIRFNCYTRQLPIKFSSYSYRKDIHIQTTPGGILGAAMGFSEGWFTGGIVTAALTGFLERIGLIKPKTQGLIDPNAANGEDKYLKSLTQVLGSKGTFAKHPDKDDIYIMTTKDGKVIEDTYQNIIDKFKGEPENPKIKGNENAPDGKVEKTEAELMAEDANAKGLTKGEDGIYRKGKDVYEWNGNEFAKKEKVTADTPDDVSLKSHDRRSPKVEVREAGSQGRYAVKQNDGTYEYYAANGKNLNPKYARLMDPKLAALPDSRFDKDQNMKTDYKGQTELAKKYNGRTTRQDGIYYDEKKKMHFKFVPVTTEKGTIINKIVYLPNVSMVEKATWKDQKGKAHSGRP